MEVKDKNILRLLSEIENIKSKKLSEWFIKTKNHLPVYVAEFLFAKNTGILNQMLYEESEDGLLYDPTILRQGIDNLMVILDGQNCGHDNSRLKALYSNFADSKIRFSYLKPIIDQLDLYPTLADEIISDVKSLIPEAQNPEELEFLQNYIRNVEARRGQQSKELAEKLARQRQKN